MLPRTLTLTINSASVFDLLLQPAFHSPMIRPKIYSSLPATEACRCYSWHPLGMSIDLRRFCLFTCTPLNFTSTTWNDAISSRLLSNRVTTSKPLPKHCRCCSYDHTSFEPSKCFTRFHPHLWSLEHTPIYTSWFTDSCTKFDT